MKKIFLILIMFAISFEASAQTPKPGKTKPKKETSLVDEVKYLVNYNITNNSKFGFSAHKQNYFLPYTRSTFKESNFRKKSEIKFRVSIKQRIFRFYGWAFYFGYSQLSFWQAYNYEKSRPFRENNFNPEFFIRTKNWGGLNFDFGFEHESNGRDLPLSRGWDRLYLTPRYENDYIILALKSWFRLPRPEKDDPQDVKGDDNPDIHEYYGYNELIFKVKIYDFRIGSMFRYNFKHKKGGMQVDLTFPMYTNSTFWHVQYWNGYGESLIDYNVKQQKFGLGVMLTR
jgi:phospholipase A1